MDRRRSKKRKLNLEALESRYLLSGTPLDWSIEPRTVTWDDPTKGPGGELIEPFRILMPNTEQYANPMASHSRLPNYDPYKINLNVSGFRMDDGSIPSNVVVEVENFSTGQSVVVSEVSERLHLFETTVEGDYRIRIRGRLGSATNVTTEIITVEDILVVAMGDSYSSGEGAPEIAIGDTRHDFCSFDVDESLAAGWAVADHENCWYDNVYNRDHLLSHRSSFAASAQMALELEQADPHTSVSFVFLSMSGATIAEGGLGEYAGVCSEFIYDKDVRMPSQIAQARQIIGSRSPDVVTLSFGGNDIGFAPVAKSLVMQREDNPEFFNALMEAVHSGTDEKWDEVRNNTSSAGGWVGRALLQLSDWIDEQTNRSGSCGPQQADLAGLSGLADAYNRLASELSTLKPKHVYITEYPDSSFERSVDGSIVQSKRILDDLLNGGGLFEPDLEANENELEWATKYVLKPLNDAIREAANSHGWTHVDGINNAFRGHGYSATPIPSDPASGPWINTIAVSVETQGPGPRANILDLTDRIETTGSLHPNRYGHSEGVLPNLLRHVRADLQDVSSCSLVSESPFQALALANSCETETMILVAPGESNTVEVTRQDGRIVATLNGEVWQTRQASRVSLIGFWGGKGRDVFENKTRIDSVAFGGEGRDKLIGGSGTDTFFGGEGRDNLRGMGGNDFLYGQGGNDRRIFGGRGADYIEGGEGDDVIKGGSGHDTIFGGLGADRIGGGRHRDTIHGGNGNDQISGGGGADTIYGGNGNDVISGGSHSDVIHGSVKNVSDYSEDETDADVIHGDSGNDEIWGGPDDDDLYGGGDSDRIWGEDGRDFIYGEDGNDSMLRGGNGDDKIWGGEGNDVLEGGDDDDRLEGDSGDDTLIGGDDNDTYVYDEYFDLGSDTIFGSAGYNILDFERRSSSNEIDLQSTTRQVVHQDTLEIRFDSSLAIDEFRGSDHSDTVYGNGNNNHLMGRGGDDYFHFRGGGDTFDGAGGDDVFFFHGLANGSVFFTGNDGVNALNFRASGHGVQRVSAVDGGYIGTSMALSRTDWQQIGQVKDRKLVNENDLSLRFEFDNTIDNVFGSNFDDKISGNSLPNLLDGFDGDDLLSGGDGNDSLFGGENNDLLFGGRGKDDLHGWNGNDYLDGGFGHRDGDESQGQAGDDILLNNEYADGGSGHDKFISNQNVTTGTGSDEVWLNDGEVVFNQHAGGHVLVADEYAGDWDNRYRVDAGGYNPGDTKQIYGYFCYDPEVPAALNTANAFNYNRSQTEFYTILVSEHPPLPSRAFNELVDKYVRINHPSDCADVNTGADRCSFISCERAAKAPLPHAPNLLVEDVEAIHDEFVLPTPAIRSRGTIRNNSLNQVEINGTIAADVVLLTGNDDGIFVELNGSFTKLPIEVTSVVVNLHDGDDYFQSDVSLNVIVNGDNGNDQLVGGSGADHLVGGLGDDTIHGGDGDDKLDGSRGNDRLFGDSGNDVMFGRRGEDLLRGGDGDDFLVGNAGDDRIFGESGDDYLIGSDGDDLLNTLDSFFENDTIEDESGTNRVIRDTAPSRDGVILNSPNLLSPGKDVPNARRQPIFEWTNIGNVVEYELRVYRTGQLVRNFLISPSTNETTQFELPDEQRLRRTTEYTWAVRGLNHGPAGPWSSEWNFTTRNAEPDNPPSDLSPSDGTTGARLNPIFSWNNLGSATSYVVRVYPDGDTTPSREFTVPAQDGSRTEIDSEEWMVPLRRLSTYQYTVTGENSRGKGPSSQPITFTTRNAPPTNPPSDLSPSDGTTGARLNPIFSWNNLGSATSYVVRVYPDGDTTPSREFTVPAQDGSRTEIDSEEWMVPLRRLSTYQYTVTGENSRGKGPSSQPITFTTRNAPLTLAPAPETPLNYVEGARRRPIFNWSNLSAADDYILEIFQNGTRIRNLTVPKGAGASTTYLLPESEELARLTTYTWTVTGRNGAGIGPTSQTFTFKTRNTPPTIAPVQLAPADTRTNVRRLATFEWSNLPTADSYVIRIFVADGREVRTITVPGSGRATTSYRLGDQSNDGGELRALRDYWWTIEGVNSAGRGLPSSRWWFRTRA